MKYLKSYNESIREYLKPKSEDDIRNTISNMDVVDVFKYIEEYELDNSFLPSDKEIKKYLNTLSINDWIKTVKKHKLDNSFLPTKKQIKDHIFNENNIKDFSKIFYKKATLIPNSDKSIIKLKSYDTIVAEFDVNTKKLKVNGWYSSTTSKHINSFISYLGGSFTLSKKELNEKPVIKI